MKSNLLKIFIAIAIAILITGCAALHDGYMSGSASLSSANFSYVKQNLQGKSHAVYVLCFGGVARKTLVYDAKQIMLQNNPLGPNQALANVTVNFRTLYIIGFIVNVVTCTVTADIVEFK